MIYFFRLELIFLCALFSCKAKSKVEESTPQVQVIQISSHDTPIIKDFIGQVFGIKEIPIRARVDGFLETMDFKEGAKVKKGQLLYTIDPDRLLSNVENQKSKVSEAIIQEAKSKSDLNRYEPLAKINAVSQSDYDAMLAEYEASVASVKASKSNLELAQINLSYARIHSPISGLIGRTKAKVGEYVGQNPNPIILNKVVKTDTILVQFFISEQDYLKMARESKNLKNDNIDDKENSEENLELVFQDGSVFNHKGKFDFINNEVDPSTGSILIQASFPNPEFIIRPGQFAKIRANIMTIKNALLIPQRSVSQLQGKSFIYLLDSKNIINEIQIKIIANYKQFFAIKSDQLKVGDRIIYEGLQKVRPNKKVSPKLIDLKLKENNDE